MASTGMEQESRNRLIRRATQLFSERGFHVVSIGQIVGASDDLRSAMQRNFRSKEELVQAVLEQRYDDILGSIAQRLKAVPNPVSKLEAIFGWYGDWFRTPEFSGCLFERALSEFGVDAAGISDVSIRYRSTLQNQMADLLRALIPHARATRLAATYMMLLHGATTAARAHGAPEVAHHAWQSAHALLNEAKRD